MKTLKYIAAIALVAIMSIGNANASSSFNMQCTAAQRLQSSTKVKKDKKVEKKKAQVLNEQKKAQKKQAFKDAQQAKKSQQQAKKQSFKQTQQKKKQQKAAKKRSFREEAIKHAK